MRRVIPTLVLMACVAACASRRPAPVVTTPAPPVRTVDVAALIRQGCYRCLEEALAAAGAQAQPELAFEAAALLVLRSKELGIPPERWMERVTQLAGDDPTRTELRAIVAAVPPDPLSGDREAMSADPAARMRERTMVPKWRELLTAGGGTPEFRTYLELALVCSFGPSDQREAYLAGLGQRLVPLLEYRASLCGFVDLARMRAVAAAGFVDAEYALGRGAMEVENDFELALRHLQSATQAFPASLGAATLIGNIYIEWEEWQMAADAFDGVLADRPTHPDALLGRTQAVSRLGRYQDGIDTATRLLGGTWFVGQAYYWRAWNYNGLKDYAAARVEADRAKTLMVNAPVFLLSGLIDWALERRPTAEGEFLEALKLDFGQCEAAFYMGAVRAELRKALEGIAAMRQATQCYDLAIAVRRRGIDSIRDGRGSESAKARQIAVQQRAIAANEERKGQAAKLIGQLEVYLTSLQAPPAAPPPSPARRAPPSAARP